MLDEFDWLTIVKRIDWLFDRLTIVKQIDYIVCFISWLLSEELIDCSNYWLLLDGLIVRLVVYCLDGLINWLLMCVFLLIYKFQITHGDWAVF